MKHRQGPGRRRASRRRRTRRGTCSWCRARPRRQGPALAITSRPRRIHAHGQAARRAADLPMGATNPRRGAADPTAGAPWRPPTSSEKERRPHGFGRFAGRPWLWGEQGFSGSIGRVWRAEEERGSRAHQIRHETPEGLSARFVRVS